MKTFIKSTFIFLISFLFSNCGDKDSDYIDPRGKTYAGSISCMECHQKIYTDALKSSHYQASAPATIKNVLGNFNSGHNTFIYDKDTKIVMENRNNKLFQVHYQNGKEVKAYPFGIVMGVKNAQTSMFWDKDNVYELPLSYYKSVNNWGTSPSYPINNPHFDRSITIGCFECHGSHLELKHKNTEEENYFGTQEVLETMKRESIVYGIDCERCHGPALDHVNFHKKNPELKLAKYIVTHKSLNSSQKLARCVLCHSNKEKKQSLFQFLPGNTIADFYIESNQDSGAPLDVHGNQYGLLSQSKCFIESKTLDCISCHDPHTNATESGSYYSQKCMSCHSEVNKNFCTTKAPMGTTLKENCIDCHMPKKESQAINFFLSGKSETSAYLLRTHKIGVYPNENQKKGSKNGH